MKLAPDQETMPIITGVLSQEFPLDLPGNISLETLQKSLAQEIGRLAGQDFEKLLFVLYRLDISEKKVRKLLAEGNPDSAEAIAQLIIERQMEKIKSRQQFRKDDNIPEAGKW